LVCYNDTNTSWENRIFTAMNKYKDKGIISLVVFGSYARGDDDTFSDLDLLGIVRDDKKFSTPFRDINLSIYSLGQLRDLMKAGDLFALHLKEEGMPLFGDDIFYSLAKEFVYKEDYYDKIMEALCLGRLIIDGCSEIKNWAIANKRIAWSVRTVIISLSAMNRTPVFSKKLISKFISIPDLVSDDILSLINIKNNNELDCNVIRMARIFFDYISENYGFNCDIKVDFSFIKKTMDLAMHESSKY